MSNKLLGYIISLEDNTAKAHFKATNQSAQIDVKQFPQLEQYLVPGMRITYDMKLKVLEVPIVKWQENNKTKLLTFDLNQS